MACDENTDISGSPKNSEYDKWKHIIDIYKEPENPKKPEWNIYRVPCNLRNLKITDAYTPQLVSIGPIHHNHENLNPIMQDHKLQYLKLFWNNRPDGAPKNKIENMDKFKKHLEDKEKDIRECYAENILDKIRTEKLVEMMLLDSVFIMELFLRIQKPEVYKDDIILKQTWLKKCIQRDLLLLENQIPFFILEELYNKYVYKDPKRKKHPTFIDLARDYFGCFNTREKSVSSSNQEAAGSSSDSNVGEPSQNGTGLEKNSSSSPTFIQLMKNCGTCKKGDSSSSGENGSPEKPKHFTDLIRYFYICKDLHHGDKDSSLKTATKLRESGISFVKVTDKPLIDIKFEKVPILSWFLCLGCFPKSKYFKARLQIPQLKVDDTTECVLRNLIAFEQCHYPNQPYICNYVSFIDSLIHTKDDVELLVEKEVIVHELGSDKEVATLVNSLCKHVVADKSCYIETINDLNKHEKRQWNRTMAALRFVYFRDTWRASSTLVATAVLVFTIFNFCRVVRLVLDLEAGNNRQT